MVHLNLNKRNDLGSASSANKRDLVTRIVENRKKKKGKEGRGAPKPCGYPSNLNSSTLSR